MNQLEIHKKIEVLLKNKPEDVALQDVNALILKNDDAKRYFFAKADERWVDYLWENGFLDVIKTASDDKSGYGYSTPEITYLVRVAEKKPASVVKIMLSDNVATNEDNFRPELVDQFLRICTELPTPLFVRVISKIQEQNWVKLMTRFSSWGFQYEKMFKNLLDDNKVEEFLQLAEVVLAVRKEDEAVSTYKDISTQSPFYFTDLSQTKVFEYLASLDEEYNEQVFKLVIDTLSKVAHLGNKLDGEFEVFEFGDTYHLFDVDFFELKLGEKKRLTYRDDVRELIAVVLEVTKKIFIPENANDLFDKYIGDFDDEDTFLPDTRAMWRLRLFVLSLESEGMKEKVKKHLWRLFDVMDRAYVDIIRGTEYKKLLQISFKFLDEKDREKYVNDVIKVFSKKSKEDTDKKGKEFQLRRGSRILSTIQNEPEVQEKIEKINDKKFELSKTYKPSKEIESSGAVWGSISPKGLISEKEFNKLSIENIVQKLGDEWTQEKLNKLNEEKGDFHNPINIDGMGELLRKNVSKRFSQYASKAMLFNDEKINAHYIYSFLRGIQESIKEEKVISSYDELIKLLGSLVDKSDNIDEDVQSEFYDTWVLSWRAVYPMIADVVQELLTERNGQMTINLNSYRDEILHIINELLDSKDPITEDEKIESAKSTTTDDESNESIVTDPYTIAINSVRGKAFQNLLFFVYQDGKEMEDEDIKIKDDVKEVYKNVLEQEKTRAIMFLFGHHFPSFYFRDKSWLLGLFDDIFPKGDDEKYYLYLAALEGYLTQTLYKEIFIEEKIQELYLQGIELENVKYSQQKNFKNPHKALAEHLALAFIHFEPFNFESELFKAFWEKANIVSKKEFISFVGRSTLSGNNAKEVIKTQKIDIDKIKSLWNWVLDNVSEQDVLAGFGLWLNTDENIFEDKYLAEMMSKTLLKSSGAIEWDYALKEKLVSFAEVDIEATFSIIKEYLLNKDGEMNEYRKNDLYGIDRDIKPALDIIYKTGDEDMKENIINLIDTLLLKGGQPFWILEEIIK